MTDQMDETMNQIYGTLLGKKQGLLNDIEKLEHDLVAAQNRFETSNESWPMYSAAISPEQALLQHRDIVFLKKDLTKKKAEYDELSE